MKRSLAILVLLALGGLLSAPAFAGDVASFQNLGFSENGRYFVFGQYGVDETSFELYAEIYAVDVRTNGFVPDGVKTASYEEQAEPGQSGIGALFTLYRESEPLVGRYSINHMKTGRLLYILVNGDEPKANLKFRDFATGRSYSVSLLQTAFGSGAEVSAAFHINLSVTEKNGTEKSYSVGLPSYRRPGVKQYKIRQVLLSPDGGALVFVVEKAERAESGTNIRYMVETVYVN